MLHILLEETPPSNNWAQYVLLAVLIVVFVVGFWWSGRANKKKRAEEEAKLNAVGPGNKVKTIGGICGIVVAIDPEEKTFVLETGDEEHGKCYIKFDRQAIYQTDAQAEPAKKEPAVIEASETEEKAEVKEAPAEEKKETAEKEEK